MTESRLKYFRVLYDQIHFPIQIINKEGKVVYVNHAFTFQWGYNISELSEYSMFNDSELRKNGLHDLIRDVFAEKGYRFINNYADSLLLSKEITPPIFRTKIFYTIIDEKDYLVFFHEDQTEMILTEAEVKKARENNKESERLKDTFLTVLSHELRTPLNIVLGYASIIKETMKDKIGPEDKIYLDNLYSGSERLYNSITQMLEFAQIEAGDFVLNIETADLIPVIQECLDQNSKGAAEKNLDIKLKINENQIPVDVDKQSLQNAINNLINNAIKFTQNGFVEIEAGILEGKELAFCRVKDSGIGISPQYLDHLFKAFSQEDLNIGRNFEGNGLGLALSKRYIERMGGSLLVESTKGVGSTFTFTIPLSMHFSKAAEKFPSGYSAPVKKILLIDDLSESYALLKAFTKDLFEIDICNFKNFTGSTISESNPDIIVMDVGQHLWNDSLKLCKEIKDNEKSRQLIILSNEFLEERIEEFYNAGADRFILKPFSRSDILKAFEENIHQ